MTIKNQNDPDEWTVTVFQYTEGRKKDTACCGRSKRTGDVEHLL